VLRRLRDGGQRSAGAGCGHGAHTGHYAGAGGARVPGVVRVRTPEDRRHPGRPRAASRRAARGWWRGPEPARDGDPGVGSAPAAPAGAGSRRGAGRRPAGRSGHRAVRVARRPAAAGGGTGRRTGPPDHRLVRRAGAALPRVLRGVVRARPLVPRSEGDSVTEFLSRTKQEILDYCLLSMKYGLNFNTQGNISVRLPEPDRYLVTPTDLEY